MLTDRIKYSAIIILEFMDKGLKGLLTGDLSVFFI